MHDATKSLRLFTSRLTEANKSLSVQDVSSNNSDMRIYPSLPLLNFLGLLLLTVQKGSADLFKQLKNKYGPYIKEVGIWDEALTSVGEMYFGIQRPRQGNPLLDMMGGMFGGGLAPPKQQQPRRIGASAPAAEGLDWMIPYHSENQRYEIKPSPAILWVSWTPCIQNLKALCYLNALDGRPRVRTSSCLLP